MKYIKGSVLTEFLPEFLNTRAKLNKAGDPTLLYAWVEQAEGRHLTLDVGSEEALSPGDICELALTSHRASAVFECSCAVVVGNQASFALPKQATLASPVEQMRRRGVPMKVEGYSSEMGWLPFEVLDIGPGGLGVRSPDYFDVGERIRLKIAGEDYRMELIAEVRYCKFDNTRPFEYRVGFLLREASRADTARWKSIVHAVPEVPKERLKAVR